MTDTTPSDLVRQALNGDQEAYGELCLQNWSGLVTLARSVLVDDGDAEDAVQDVLVHGWKKLPALRDPSVFSSWLKKSLLRECIRRAKRRKQRSTSTFDPAAIEIADPPNQPSVDVPRALAELSPRQRAVVFLGEVRGLDDRQIADLLSIRQPTVRVHRLRARDRLRQLLGDAP